MTPKHKFKRMKRFVYIVMAKCEICGLEREGTKGNYTYRFPFNDNRITEEPICKPKE